MATIITLPSVVADATDAVIQGWLVKVGDSVDVGDPIADIETEKATVELEAETSGTVGRLLVEAGTTVPVGDPIAVLTTEGDDDASIEAALAEVGATTPDATEPRPGAESNAQQASTDQEPTRGPAGAAGPHAPTDAGHTTGPATPGSAARHGDRVFSSPLARRRARELGVNLAVLPGSGPGGRILRADVETAAESGATSVVVSDNARGAVTSPRSGETGPRSDAGDAAFERIALTGMRAAIARRLTESKTTVPHFYLSVDVEMDALMAMRRQVNAELAARAAPGRPAQSVTVNDLCLKALGLALVDVPEANVAWGGDHVRRFRSVDVSVAIATEGGLVTPVVRGLQDTSLLAVSGTMRDFKERAASGRIKQRDLEGGSFSLTNLGMFGTREFSAILNPPQAGILALGAGEQRPVVRDGELSVATVMTATLSADHRVIDGAVAAQLAAAFRKRIEQPLSLLL